MDISISTICKILGLPEETVFTQTQPRKSEVEVTAIKEVFVCPDCGSRLDSKGWVMHVTVLSCPSCKNNYLTFDSISRLKEKG